MTDLQTDGHFTIGKFFKKSVNANKLVVTQTVYETESVMKNRKQYLLDKLELFKV